MKTLKKIKLISPKIIEQGLTNREFVSLVGGYDGCHTHSCIPDECPPYASCDIFCPPDIPKCAINYCSEDAPCSMNS